MIPSFRRCALLTLFLVLTLSYFKVQGAEIKNRLKPGFAQRHPAHLTGQFDNARTLAQTGVQKQAELFSELRKNFAQQSTTEEEAFLEIAKKLMKLADVLDELEDCMN